MYTAEFEETLGLDLKEVYANYASYAKEGGTVVNIENAYAEFGLNPSTAPAWKKGLDKVLTRVSVINPPPDLPSVPTVRFTNEGLVKLLQEKQIKIRAKKDWIKLPAFDENTTFGPFRDKMQRDKKYNDLMKNDKVVVGIEKEGDLYIKVKFPYPDYKKGNTVPSYTPSFKSFGANRWWVQNMYLGLSQGRYGNKENTDLAIKIYRTMCTILEEWVVCNGTPAGMITRFEQMKKASLEAIDIRSRNPIDVEKLTEDLARWCPRDINIGLLQLNNYDLPTLFSEKLVDRDTGEKNINWKFKLNRNAGAGALWKGATEKKLTKGQTFLVDMQLATNMMKDLSRTTKRHTSATKAGLESQLRKDYGEIPPGTHIVSNDGVGFRCDIPVDEDEAMEMFWKDWNFILLFNMFPKTDPYLLRQIYEKTRCIAGRGSYETLPSVLLFAPFFENLRSAFDYKPCVFNTKTRKLEGFSMSMMASSPFGGNFDILYKWIKSLKKMEDGSTLILAFADNIMVWIKQDDLIYNVSLDFVKAESTVALEDVLACNLYALRSHENVTIEWYRYATKVLPKLAVDGVALLGNQQLNYRWLASGTNGTHFYNFAQAIRTIMKSTELTGPNDHNPFFNLRTESLEDTPVFKSQAFTGSKVEIECWSKWDGVYSDQPIVMGVIGFDMVVIDVSPDDRAGVCILQFERLLKGVVLNKGNVDEEGATKHDTFTAAYIELMKYKSLMVLGGWYYPPLRKDLWDNAVRAHRKIVRLAPTAGTQIDMVDVENMLNQLEVPPEWVMSLISALNQPTMPSMYDVFRVLLGDKSRAYKAVMSRVGTMPNTHLITYEEMEDNGGDPEGFGLKKYVSASLPDMIDPLFMDYDVKRIYNQGSGIKYVAPKEMFSKDLVANVGIQAPQERVAILDVATPNLKKAGPKGPVLVRQDDLLESLDKAFRSVGGYQVFRVPVPESDWSELHEMKDERRAAFTAMTRLIKILSNEDDDKIHGFMTTWIEYVLFIIKPWTLLTGAETKNEDGSMGDGTPTSPFINKLTTGIKYDTIKVPLRPGVLYPSRDVAFTNFTFDTRNKSDDPDIIYIGTSMFRHSPVTGQIVDFKNASVFDDERTQAMVAKSKKQDIDLKLQREYPAAREGKLGVTPKGLKPGEGFEKFSTKTVEQIKVEQTNLNKPRPKMADPMISRKSTKPVSRALDIAPNDREALLRKEREVKEAQKKKDTEKKTVLKQNLEVGLKKIQEAKTQEKESKKADRASKQATGNKPIVFQKVKPLKKQNVGTQTSGVS